MTVKGFSYISAACGSLREVVMNDMPTLSDRCVLVSLHRSLLFIGGAACAQASRCPALAGSAGRLPLPVLHVSAGRPLSFQRRADGHR